jgi:hypothetical protein
VSRAYRCQCGRPVFFRNSRCLNCGAPLGYEPHLGRVMALESAAGDAWRVEDNAGEGKTYYRCDNLYSPAACNWLVSGEEKQTLCISCRLNRTIPDLSVPGNEERWRRIEDAKRRLISALLAMGLPVFSRAEDPEHGLTCDLLHTLPGGPRVMTGHNNGLITLNIEEADDATRERVREEMHEPYRTLLGHLRHEIGHYYWDRLVKDSAWLDLFRELFGDEREDYAAALQRYHSQGPRPDWMVHYVSAYSSAHPWEDWAESWAHYLHMSDTTDTVLSFGLNLEHAEMEIEPFTPEDLFRPGEPGAERFLDFINSWTRLSSVMNEVSRSMGLPDFYPFVLSGSVVAKLHLIHMVVAEARVNRETPRRPD